MCFIGYLQTRKKLGFQTTKDRQAVSQVKIFIRLVKLVRLCARA